MTRSNEYEQGREDAINGIPYMENPYPYGSPQADDWDDGWYAGVVVRPSSNFPDE